MNPLQQLFRYELSKAMTKLIFFKENGLGMGQSISDLIPRDCCSLESAANYLLGD